MLKLVIDARKADLGGGFEVRRILPFRKRRMVGPSVTSVGGQITHRDSLGVQQVIRPGETGWTAGRGIAHSERFGDPAQLVGGALEMIQSLVALPEADEETDPSFHHHDVVDLPSFEDDGVSGRLILGDAFGRGAQVHIRSPLFYLHWQFATGARVEMPAEYPECEIHVTTGAIAIDRQRFETGQMLVLVAGQPVIIRCHLNALCGCMRRDIGLAERR